MIAAAFFETASGALLVPIYNQFVPTPGVKSKTLFDLSAIIPLDDWYRAWMVISGLLIAFTFLNGVADFISAYIMAKIGQSSVLKLREELYGHLLKQSTAFFERQRTNFLVSRLVVSCSAIELAVSSNLRDVLREACMLAFFFSAAFYYSWRLMVGALIIGPLVAFLTSWFSKRLRKLADESLAGTKELSDTAQETLTNQVIVKAYSAERRERERFVDVAKRITRANLRSARIAATAPPSIEFIGIVLFVVVFYFGLREINAGHMAPSQFFAFLFFLFRSYDPLRKISRQHNEITKALAAAKDVWSILDISEMTPEREDAVTVSPLRNEIRLENVSFSYRNNKKRILRNINLAIPKGSVVALVGESGGGKSSLVKLIQRLYDPSEGRILWDGVDLRDTSLDSLRKQIALVTQETVLFNDTIFHNISYGDPNATLTDIEEAARVAYADEFITQLPSQYDTIVGERGMLLTGGQRPRIAISRAVPVNAPVLIPAEATSAPRTENQTPRTTGLSNPDQNRSYTA